MAGREQELHEQELRLERELDSTEHLRQHLSNKEEAQNIENQLRDLKEKVTDIENFDTDKKLIDEYQNKINQLNDRLFIFRREMQKKAERLPLMKSLRVRQSFLHL